MLFSISRTVSTVAAPTIMMHLLEGLTLIGVGANIGPELVDFLVAQHVFPRRHLVLAVAHRIVETSAVAGGEPAQIEDLAGALEAIAVTGLAVVVVGRLPCLDGGLVLRRG